MTFFEFKFQIYFSTFENIASNLADFFMVPKNMTHLLEPLDLTTNASVKKMEKKCFSEYFTNAITKEMLRDPKRDKTTIEIDLRLSTLKPEHAKVMRKVYEFLSQKKVVM